MDGFYTGNPEGDGSDEYALGYYLKADLGFIPHVAAAYTLYDRWFCSIMASTYPNRHYQLGRPERGPEAKPAPRDQRQRRLRVRVGDDPRPGAGPRPGGRLLRLRHPDRRDSTGRAASPGRGR